MTNLLLLYIDNFLTAIHSLSSPRKTFAKHRPYQIVDIIPGIEAFQLLCTDANKGTLFYPCSFFILIWESAIYIILFYVTCVG